MNDRATSGINSIFSTSSGTPRLSPGQGPAPSSLPRAPIEKERSFRHPKLRGLALFLYGLPMAVSMIFLIQSIFYLMERGGGYLANKGSTDLFFVTAFGSHITASIVLIFWAWKIRKADKLAWVKGTEVLREVTGLYLAFVAIVAGAILHVITSRWLNDLNQLLDSILVFLSIALWTQTLGPGWTSYREAREQMAGGPPMASKPWWSYAFLRAPHTLEWTLLIAAQSANVLVLYVFYLASAAIREPQPREVGIIWVFVAVNLILMIRILLLASAQGAMWTKATQAARQVAVGNLIFLVLDEVQLGLFGDQNAFFEKIIGAVTAFIFAGTVGLIFGPGRSTHVEIALALNEKDVAPKNNHYLPLLEETASTANRYRRLPLKKRYLLTAASLIVAAGAGLVGKAVVPTLSGSFSPRKIGERLWHHQS